MNPLLCPQGGNLLVNERGHVVCPLCHRMVESCCEGEPTPHKEKAEEEDEGQYGHDHDY